MKFSEALNNFVAAVPEMIYCFKVFDTVYKLVSAGFLVVLQLLQTTHETLRQNINGIIIVMFCSIKVMRQKLNVYVSKNMF